MRKQKWNEKAWSIISRSLMLKEKSKMSHNLEKRLDVNGTLGAHVFILLSFTPFLPQLFNPVPLYLFHLLPSMIKLIN